MDEILVKGQDGEWYILKGEEMVPYDAGTQDLGMQVRGEDLPKGVSREGYEKLERGPVAAGLAPAPKAAVKAAATLPAPVSHAEHPLRVELEELIDRVVHEVMETWKHGNMETNWDTVLQKRFRTIVSARLRDVRDARETQEMLTRGQKVGGMGLPPPPPTPPNLPSGRGGTPPRAGGENIDLVMGIIEKAFGEFQAKWKEAEEKKRAAWQQKQIQERAAREEQKIKQEQEGLEERYRRMVGSAVPRQQPAQKPQSVRPANVPVAAGLAPAPKAATLSALVPKAAVKAAATPAIFPRVALPPPPTQAVVVPKPKSVVVAVPKPAVVPPKPFVPSAEQSSVSARPGKVTDIRPAPKLVGPIEEIASLRLEDFRRLPGASAPERAQKIMEKIELLGKESLSRRSQGLEAWRNCPINQLYGQILGAALQNRKPPHAILTEWAALGKTSLTLDEFRAIMDLNAKLRF